PGIGEVRGGGSGFGWGGGASTALAPGQAPPDHPRAEPDHHERHRHLDAAADRAVRLADHEVHHDPRSENKGHDAHEREWKAHSKLIVASARCLPEGDEATAHTIGCR